MSLDNKMISQLGIFGTALGGGLTGGGQIAGGFAASNKAAYEAAVFQNNYLIAKDAERAAIKTGRIAEQEKLIETAQTIGKQRVALAGSGIVVDRDTALTLALDAQRIGKQDAIQIRENAQRKALAAKLTGINYLNAADIAKSEGRASLFSGLVQGAGTLLGTASAVNAKWLLYNNQYGSVDTINNDRHEVFG